MSFTTEEAARYAMDNMFTRLRNRATKILGVRQIGGVTPTDLASTTVRSALATVAIGGDAIKDEDDFKRALFYRLKRKIVDHLRRQKSDKRSTKGLVANDVELVVDPNDGETHAMARELEEVIESEIARRTDPQQRRICELFAVELLKPVEIEAILAAEGKTGGQAHGAVYRVTARLREDVQRRWNAS